MTRLLVIFALLVALAALIASDRAKPLFVEPHSSGKWAFNKADFDMCMRVDPGPLRAPRKDWLHPNSNSEKV